MESIISVQGVSKKYGKVTAVDNVCVEVQAGSITALLGPNGAGKTTLIRMLTTLLNPDSGSITIAGLDVVHDAQALRAQFGLSGQNASLDGFLTGRENLLLVGRLYHLKSLEVKSRTNVLLQQLDLEEAADRPVKTYSGGMKRRLDLAASLLNEPAILFLDEPTTGLDPHSRFTLWQIIRERVKQGTTVLLTTQYLEEADQLAQNVVVIDKGKIIANGSAEELKRQVGGEMLELHLKNLTETERAAQTIAQFSIGQQNVHPETGAITMAVTGGATVMAAVIRALDQKKIELNNIALRRPSLDDVFLKLTGHEAQ